VAKLKQIKRYIDIEEGKLVSLRQQYQQAQQYQQQQQKRLSDLEQYRLQYLREIKIKVSSGSKVNELIQYQNFVAKLDKACEQQVAVISQAVLVVAQRKQQYVSQQKRVDAIAKFHKRKETQEQKSTDRIVQKQIDEMANQNLNGRRTSPFSH